MGAPKCIRLVGMFLVFIQNLFIIILLKVKIGKFRSTETQILQQHGQ